MNIEETAVLLGSGNEYINESGVGVTYYKLNPSIKFGGDVTKGCGLLGEDVDKNFYFLRGYDISGMTIDENRNLVITRLNPQYAPLVVSLSGESEDYEFEFDPEQGIITITYPDGTIKTLEGFYVEDKNAKVLTDHTLVGKGTLKDPLRISPTEKTGMMAPVDEYFDISADGVMPEGKFSGYRVVTKEKANVLGRLYPLDALDIISEKLERVGSEWRVPTKEDWDDLLNSLECEEYRNHTASGSNAYFGEIAGQCLKSEGTYTHEIGDGDGLWKHCDVDPGEEPVDGQDAVGMKVLPLGRSSERNEVMQVEDEDIEGLGLFASFWTATKDGDNGYMKTFSWMHRDVRQELRNKLVKASVRLVKEYKYGNYSEIENILGLNYTTTLVPTTHDDYEYLKVWTVNNFYDDDPILSGSTAEEWSAITETVGWEDYVYYVGEWRNGVWTKKPMRDGDSVVIKDKDGYKYYEWRVEKGEFVNTISPVEERLEALRQELTHEIAELRGLVNNITINGTDKEIKVTKESSESAITFTVGFADDAIFGEME